MHIQTATPEAFIPLALEAEDIATYASIAEALGCDTETCAEAFMLATPLAREAAVRLWQGIQILGRQEGAAPIGDTVPRALKARQALDALRSLMGLDPAAMPLDALAAAGLRYSA